MKKLIVILIFFASCKKKEVTPIVEEPVCQISADKFTGTYVSASNDTVKIIFLHNNCPESNSNTYLVKGIGKVAQPMLKSGYTFPNTDYEIIADEKTGYAKHLGIFTFGKEATGNLLFNSFKINQDNVGLQKI